MKPLDYITKVTLAAWCNAYLKKDEPLCECGHRMSSHCLDDECCNFSYELGEIAGYCFGRLDVERDNVYELGELAEKRITNPCGCFMFRPSKQWLIEHETMSHRPYCGEQFGWVTQCYLLIAHEHSVEKHYVSHLFY